MDPNIYPPSGPGGDREKGDSGPSRNFDSLIVPRLAHRPIPGDSIMVSIARAHNLARISSPRDQQIISGLRDSFSKFIAGCSRDHEREGSAGARWVTAYRQMPVEVLDHTGLSSPAHALCTDGGLPRLPVSGVVPRSDGGATFLFFCQLRNRDGEAITYGSQGTAFAYKRTANGDHEQAVALISAWGELSLTERATLRPGQRLYPTRYATMLNSPAFDQEIQYILSKQVLDPTSSRCAPGAWLAALDGIAAEASRHANALRAEEVRPMLRVRSVESLRSERHFSDQESAERVRQISECIVVDTNYGRFEVTISWSGAGTPHPFQRRVEVQKIR